MGTKKTATAKRNPPSDGPLSVDDARRTLRNAKLRCTPSRLAVLQCLAAAGKPLSHVEAAERLSPGGFDPSTIYRCLNDFAEAGLAARLDLGDHVWRFGYSHDPQHDFGNHPHFICIDCGKVTCLPKVSVKVSLPQEREPGAASEVTEVLLKGHCAECR